MLNEISKKKLLTMGAIYVLAGVSMIAFSALIFTNPKIEVNYSVEKSKALKNCESKLSKVFTVNQKVYQENGLITQYKYKIDKTKDEIQVKTNNIDAVNNVFKDMDSMLLYCEDLRMTSFCMGDGCKNAKVELIMEFNGIEK